MKIKVLKDKTPEGIVEKIELFNVENKVFFSPILYAKSQFVCFVYYDPSKYLANEKKEFKGFKNPNAPATQKQIALLRKRNLFKPNLTISEASKLIGQRNG